MKVFLSWSGERSKAAAEAFREWLPYVINAVEPWVSSRDIDAGKRWGLDLQQQLEYTRFGIVFVTPGNVEAPWLLFEAGSLAKTTEDTHVCTYLLGMTPQELPTSPLTQFQAKTWEKESTLELVQTVNRALKEDAIAADRIEKAFSKWWPDLKKKLDELPAEDADAKEPPSLPEMVAETLAVVRVLERGFRRFGNRMMEEREGQIIERLHTLETALCEERLLTNKLKARLRAFDGGQLFGEELSGTDFSGTGTTDPDYDT
jgi:hypothetical protein